MCNLRKYLLFQVQELISVRGLIYVFNLLFVNYIHDSNRNIYILKNKRFIYFFVPSRVIKFSRHIQIIIIRINNYF